MARTKAQQQVKAERTARRLDELYAQLPRLACKGKCAHSCIPIDMAPGERARVRREYEVEIPEPEGLLAQGCSTCAALKDGRCTVYSARPMICRLWGIDETMACPHGCVPEGGHLPLLESHRFSLKTYLIAGWPSKMKPMTAQEVAKHLSSESTREYLAEARDRALARQADKRRRSRFGWLRRTRPGN